MQLKDSQNTVIATARDTANSQGLQELKAEDNNSQLKLIDLDVSKIESIQEAVQKRAELLPWGLNHLVSNASVSYNGLKTFEVM
jgi:short-subunit dehydrogenase